MLGAMSVDTRKARRRELDFKSLAEVSADLDRLESAHHAGTLKASGNWTPGQVFEHLAIFMACPIDGFPPGKPPLHIWLLTRWIIRPVALKGGPPPAGIKLPKEAAFLLPPEGTSFEKGIGDLRRQITRVTEKGERFTHPSPVFGPLTHEQWTTLQLGHCKLHLSFLDPG